MIYFFKAMTNFSRCPEYGEQKWQFRPWTRSLQPTTKLKYQRIVLFFYTTNEQIHCFIDNSKIAPKICAVTSANHIWTQ